MERSRPSEWLHAAVVGAGRFVETQVTSFSAIVQELLGMAPPKSRRLLLVPLAAAAVSAGCAGGAGGAASGIAPLSTHLIAALPGVVLDGPVWLSSVHRLVVTYTPPGKGTDAASRRFRRRRAAGHTVAMRDRRLPNEVPAGIGGRNAAQPHPVAERHPIPATTLEPIRDKRRREHEDERRAERHVENDERRCPAPDHPRQDA